MSLPTPRYELVRAPEALLSSYDARGKTGGPRADLVPLHRRSRGYLAPWAAGAALALDGRARAAGWDLRWTETWRPIPDQLRARQRYLGGKGPKAVAPGRSAHGYAGAVDIHTGPLAASGCTLAAWHEALAATGWRPIIPSTASWATSESWHADCWGPLEGIRRHEGYSEAAMAGHLLCGQWDHLVAGGWSEERVAVACLQVSLLRAGYRCGAIDGLAGRATLAAMVVAGIPQGVPWARAAETAYTLPTDLRRLDGATARAA